MSHSKDALARVLVVDDDSNIRRSLTRILRSQGFEVVEAENGHAALAAIEHGPLDLVILDIRMPGIDGVETFRLIRERLPQVPGIFMTAYSSSSRAEIADKLGGIEVLAKPLQVDLLLELAKAAIVNAPILIVDDQPEARRSLARALAQLGIETATASSFEEASRLLRQRPERVVIADVFLGDGNGLDLLQEVRHAAAPPLVFVTGFAERLERILGEKGLSNGELIVLPKPLDISSLASTIEQLQST